MGYLLIKIVLLHLGTGFLGIASAEVCGTPLVSDRIVGGQNAMEGEWPWQASIQVDGQHICGGTLITNGWVVSAAHCYYKLGYAVSRYSVCLGMYQLSGSSPNGVCSAVTNIIVNSLYTSKGGPGDISLFQLATAAGFTTYIMPVCLPAANVQFPSGMDCWVTGWGRIRTSVPLPAPQTLQEVMVPLIDQPTCDNLYHIGSGVSASVPIVLSDQICAGYVSGGKDSCQGDSGGPLVCNAGGAWYLVGIVSWGTGCALPNRPGVYSLLTAYDSWIQQYVPGVAFGQVNITMKSCGSSARIFPLLLPIILLFLLKVI